MPSVYYSVIADQMANAHGAVTKGLMKNRLVMACKDDMSTNHSMSWQISLFNKQFNKHIEDGHLMYNSGDRMVTITVRALWPPMAPPPHIGRSLARRPSPARRTTTGSTSRRASPPTRR